MICDPNNLRKVFESIVEHHQACSRNVSEVRDALKWLIGFRCECGEEWLMRLVQFKNQSSSAPFVNLVAFPEPHKVAAAAVNAGSSVEDLAKLNAVSKIMSS